MNLLTKLFVLATFLGSSSAIDREPIESPDWLNNPPQEYVAATGSTIEKAFLWVIYNYSQQKGFDQNPVPFSCKADFPKFIDNFLE